MFFCVSSLIALLFSCIFFFQRYGDHRDLHSFPTRRSSDLGWRLAGELTSVDVEKKFADTFASVPRSEEHTSELQSLRHLVCRLLLEKKKYSVSCKTRTASTSSNTLTVIERLQISGLWTSIP